MPQRLFMTAAGQSTVALAMNNSQTTAVLGSTANFPVPLAFQQFSAIILDTGNPAFNANSPLSTPFEYIFVTGNNTGTNTLTFSRGQESSSAHSFFAGATIAGMPLPSDFTQSFAQKIGDNTLGGLSTVLGTFTIPACKGIKVRGKAQGNGATVDIGIQFNSDSAANYSMTQLFATSGTPSSTGPATSTSALIAQAVSGSSCSFEAYIPTPNDTTLANHTLHSVCSSQGLVLIRASYWNQSGVSITSLAVLASGNCIPPTFVEVEIIP